METFPIYHVSFPSTYLMASTMLRFQEHYESPKFRGKVFDLEEYMDWYAAEHGGFTYLTGDWVGFNVPSWALKPFYYRQFDPLLRKEQQFLDLFEEVEGPFYVIATAANGDPGTLAHECVHGLFSLDAGYRTHVHRILERYPLRRFRRAIAEMGYHRCVIEDECNAHLTTGIVDTLRGKDVLEAHRARKRLVQLCIDRFDIDPSARNADRRFRERIHLLEWPA